MTGIATAGRRYRDAVTDVFAPNAARFDPLPPEVAARWANFGSWGDEVFFPKHVGLVVEEIRTDYARIRLPWVPHVAQPAGVAHGGAIATLIDTVVVPAIGTAYDEGTLMSTISMNVQYLGPVVGTDAVAEGWIERRGRSIVFCRAEVRAGRGDLVATGTLTYKVSVPRA